ncbi:DUF4257 domain-containing protein [Paenibacillus sp. Y412MC10]|uniref:DUF4257 domain-containing protein n=1 Tax=Geobacillus sp. (strain Y412MC10) TaxID=481743 RepID=UPI0011AB8DD2|nr:DUF4257 domain-containing protein [Paenibacillus sp. Y412MC10]
MTMLIIAFLIGGAVNAVVSARIDGVLLPYAKKVGKKRYVNLGILGDFLIGGFAALAATALLEPSTLIKVVGTSVLAGFNGLSFLAKNALARSGDPSETEEVDKMYKKFMGETDDDKNGPKKGS